MPQPRLPHLKPQLTALGKHLRSEFISEERRGLPWWALLVGLVIFMGLGMLRFTPYVRVVENEGIDRVMQWSRPYGLEKKNPVALVEINQETYTRWGEPTRLPHDRLAAVLEGLARYKPGVIVFDFDLATAMQKSPRAEQLYAYLGTERLQQTLRRYGQGQPDAPKLVLMRTFRRSQGLACVRYSRVLDDSVVAANPHIALASPTFLNEGVVRFWQFSTARSELAQCGEVSAGVLSSTPQHLPSVQLLLLWLTQDLPAPALYERLQTCVSKGECWVRLGGHSINLGGNQQGEQRVIYSLPWGSQGGAVRYPAWALENPANYNTWPPLEALEGRVVFVGSTYQPNEDWHRTAIGMMPGVWVLVNAYYSLRDSGQLRPLAWGWRLGLGVLLLGIYTLLRHWLKSGWIKRLMGYVFLIVAVYVGTLFSQQALWVDVVLMIFTLQLVERLVTWVNQRKKAFAMRKQEAT